MEKNLPHRMRFLVKETAGFKVRGKQLLLLCVLFISVSVSAQLQLVKDINQNHNPEDREYREAVDRNGTLFFISNTELWKTNGTVTANFMIKRFRRIHSLTHVSGTVFFAADDGSGFELWKTTGTTAGTVKVKEIMAGTAGSDPQQFTTVNNILYFVANNGVNGRELWKSDGTTAGTVLVRDILNTVGSSNPSFLTAVNDVLFFAANDGQTGYEVWRTDGTPGGTVRVKDIKTGRRTGSSPRMLTHVGGVVYFTADDGITGRELWRSDGTTDGTWLVKDIRSGSQSTIYQNLVGVNGTLFFSANDGVHGEELWKCDGTTAGTRLVKDLNPGPKGSGRIGVFSPTISNFTDVNGKLYFTAHKQGVYYFWKSDGTEAGTVNFLPANGLGIMDLRPSFKEMNGSVYFYNGGEEYPFIGLKLMREDAQGKIIKVATLLLNDYYSSENQFLVRSRDLLYLAGRRSETEGYALFKTNGHPSGPVWVTDTYIRKDQPSDPRNFVKIGKIVYFTVTINEKMSLWKTDGTEGGTVKVIGLDYIGDLEDVNGQLFFAGYAQTLQGMRWDIYKTDGTEAGTLKLGIGHPENYNNPTHLTNVNGKLFFVWGSHDLWVTDGTTHQYVATGSYLNTMYALGDHLYFRGYDNLYGSELWRSDGTPQGTRLVKDINPGGHSGISHFTSVNSTLFFSANDGMHGHELWRSDGTTTGTYMVKDARTDDEDDASLYDIHSMVAGHELLYFFSRVETGGWKLWRSDGTVAGTTAVADVPSPVASMGSNDRLYFVAYNGSYQLWKSDGTASTTETLAELNAGPYFSSSVHHVTVNDVFYFSFGREYLWRSDGTACGTYAINEVAGNPASLVSLDDEILFAAYDEAVGTELFKVNVQDITPGPCATMQNFAEVNTGIADPFTEAHIRNYPNPFQADFALQVNGEEGGVYRIEIFDTRQVNFYTDRNMMYNRTYAIGSSLAPGIYLLKIHDGDKTTMRRIVKK